MRMISSPVPVIHCHAEQSLASFAKAGSLGTFLDAVVLQIVKPFLKRGSGNLIEFVDTDDIIFRENLFRPAQPDFVFLLGVHLQAVVAVYTDKGSRAVIQIVTTPSQVEIEDIDGIHLLHVRIEFAYMDMFRDSFGNAVEHTLQIVELACQLHLHNDDFPFAVQGLNVHTIKLVRRTFLIALAFQYFRYRYFFLQQNGNQAFQHGKICLVAQHTLHGPVETDEFIFKLHNLIY